VTERPDGPGTRGEFGGKRGGKAGWAKYDAQEPGNPGKPDIKPPPHRDAPELEPEDPEGPGSPPFTGEDLEDAGEPNRNPDQPYPM
jgi:hypothetical protein